MVILPIFGIGGIGKTTLAQLVFNDPTFQDYSPVWVYVSETMNLNEIGNSIISQLTDEISQIVNKQMLHNRLRKLFTGKSILIVLDDLWEENPDKLNDMMTMLKLGTRRKVIVIVTTRDEAIAKMISGPAITPYKLEILTDDMCWTIIKQKSAFKDRVDKKQLEHIGMEIAIKCGGVALAAHSLGYMLRGMTSDLWESVRDNCIWNLSPRNGPSSRVHKVLASLLLSYSHMPDWLKLCFSYCAIFPKGSCIEKFDLIHQWIALGFTEQSKIFDSMQLCENYVTQLLGMSFLQYPKTPLIGRRQDKDATFFTMHDLVHDLAKEILAHQIDAGGNKCRYALLTDCSKSLQLLVTFPANIKALYFRDCGKRELCSDAFSPAKCLRILDLSECFIKKLPDCIGQLKQLRFLHAPGIQDDMIPNCITELFELNYLNFRDSPNISALPESIGDMKGLMHLDLSDCNGIHELPISFTELKQLVHLDLSRCRVSISEAFGGFTKLQYLNLAGTTIIDAVRGLSKVIGNLSKLRYLNLSRCMGKVTSSEIDSLIFCISTLSNLEHLNLSWNSEISFLPESIGNLRKLHTLNLSGCFSLKKLPDSIDQMVSLKVIKLESLDLDVLDVSRFNCASLPHFQVRASFFDKCSSNIILLEPTNPVLLIIDRLENVKSAGEAHNIKLIEKRNIESLKLEWTVAASRFVDDKELLEKLVPPSSVQRLYISGYMSVSVPDWLMSIRQYLPNLFEIDLYDFPVCNNLPPLGQLPNLKELDLRRIEGLEDWNTGYTSGEEGANELIFPKLESLTIEQCPKLRIKPCMPRATSLCIRDSDTMLSSWGESSSHCSTCSSSPLTELKVVESKVPMHQWRLPHHLPVLSKLTISACRDLTASPEIIHSLSSLRALYLELLSQAELPRWLVELTSLQGLYLYRCAIMSLPEWLGELTSLKRFVIGRCEGIRSLPDSIQVTKLEYLCIDDGCPKLVKWCKSKENKMKLAHIEKVNFLFDSDEDSEEEDIAEDISDDSEEEGGIAGTVEETTNSLDTANGSRNIEETIELDNSAAVIHSSVTDEVHRQFKMCCIVM